MKYIAQCVKLFMRITQIVKGMTNMLHTSYKTPDVLTFTKSLICSYGYRDYKDLSVSDKQELVSYLIDTFKHDEFCCITDAKHSDQTINLLKKMLRGEADIKTLFDTIKTNALDYYDSTMEEIFNYTLDMLEDN
jgi:hypothetical protein